MTMMEKNAVRILMALGCLTLALPRLHAVQAGTYDVATAGPASIASTILGQDNSDMFGPVVKGDFNGDGITDIALSGYGADTAGNARAWSGEIGIYYGKASPAATISTDNPDVKIIAPINTRIGNASIVAGNLNNDGYDDLVYLCSNDSNGSSFPPSRSIFILWGGPALPSLIDAWYGSFPGYMTILRQPAPTPIGVGVEASDAVTSLVMADLDNDGKNDLFLGAPSNDGPPDAAFGTGTNERLDAGEVHVLMGLGGAWPMGTSIYYSTSTAMTYLTIFGAQGRNNPGTTTPADPLTLYDAMGSFIAVGDVVGNDGFKDIMVNAYHGDGPNDLRPEDGEVYVIKGSTSLSNWGFSYLATKFSPSTIGISQDRWAVNRYANVQIAITNGTGTGQVRFVTSNSTDTLTVGTNWTTTPDNTSVFQIRCVDLRYGEQYLTIYGRKEGTVNNFDHFGKGLKSGDLNQDGTPDIVISAPYSEVDLGSENDEGRLYGIFGATSLGLDVNNAANTSVNTIGDVAPGWIPNRYAGSIVQITSGACAGLIRPIVSNTNNTLTVSPAWNVASSTWGVSPGCVPTSTSSFHIATLDMQYELPGFVIEGPANVARKPGNFNDIAIDDVNNDGMKDLMFGAQDPVNASGITYILFGSGAIPSGVIPLSSCQVSITGAGYTQGSTYGPYMVGGDFNGDGSSSEVMLCDALYSSAKGACYLFMQNKVPLAEMGATLNGKKFTNYYRVKPDNTMGEVMRSKVSSP